MRGNRSGVLACVAILLFALSGEMQAQQFQVLHSFSGGSDGGFPNATVTFDRNGNLYGTTFDGTVYEIDSAGTENVLHSFIHHEGTGSYGTVVRDSAGNLYGTNSEGGLNNLGTVFRLSSLGHLAVLVSWGKFGNTLEGWDPVAGLVSDSSGNLYGTTYYGGLNDMGTVYKVDHRTGAFTLLYGFGDLPDGCCPTGEVLLAKDGNLYGTLGGGGEFNWGALFKLDPTTGIETRLYSFSNGVDGGLPAGNLARDAAGNLYGATYQGGANKLGTVFRFDPGTSTLTTLHSFGSQVGDGGNPFAGVVMDKAGNLYGTTYYGSNAYKLAPDGTFTTLYTFAGGTDGEFPWAGVTLYKGSVYGTTQQGGQFGYGIVYKITP